MDIDQVIIDVPSSSGEGTYAVVVTRTRNGPTITCTCEGAGKGWPCKHRLGVLTANANAFTGDSRKVLLAAQAIFANSAVTELMAKMPEYEAQIQAIKDELNDLKRMMARWMDEGQD